MSEIAAKVPLIALAGTPNCGKTALFNALTGGRQKVANYPGVTVERKEGRARSVSGHVYRILDLPGTYSLEANTPDEEIARDVLLGRQASAVLEEPVDALVTVADATSLERSLGLILELRRVDKPAVLALNMMDLASSRGMELDVSVLSRELGVPVVPTVAVKGQGIGELLEKVEGLLSAEAPRSEDAAELPVFDDVRARAAEVDRIIRAAIRKSGTPSLWTDRIDRVVLHPVWGTLVLVSILALMFQAIFTWAGPLQDGVEGLVMSFGAWLGGLLPEGALRSLLVDGVIAGVGGVVVFLPQILLLFLFILALEDSGYMSRAAFLMDRMMARVGLHGRAFIPMLSGHACAIPAIMATRTIENPRDRLATILVVPMTTCSARLPVYALLIAAFIPNAEVFGPFRAQGLVMLGLYAAGVLAALAVAAVLRRTMLKGAAPSLLMELPTYKIPNLRNVIIGMWERSRLFLRRAGTVILSLSVVIWFLVSYPKPAADPVTGETPAVEVQDSYAGRIGRAIEPIFRPVGYDWRISTGLIPGFAAREVMVGALATVYAVESEEDDEEALQGALGQKLAMSWSLATALSLLAWYIFAPQCISTLAIARRETNSWRWPIFMLVYLTVLAYAAAFVVYRAAVAMGWG